MQEGRAGLLGSYVAWRKRNKADIWKLGALLIQYKSLYTYTSRTHADTYTHTQTLRVAQWAHLCRLGAVA